MGDLTDNFSWNEFECKCGCGDNHVDVGFVIRLQKARDMDNEGWEVNSGVRCLKHNREVGSADSSSHIKGLAVDIRCVSDKRRFAIVRVLLMAGFTRIGVSKYFIHVDADTSKSSKVMWTY